jgi:hypothetical protein
MQLTISRGEWRDLERPTKSSLINTMHFLMNSKPQTNRTRGNNRGTKRDLNGTTRTDFEAAK